MMFLCSFGGLLTPLVFPWYHRLLHLPSPSGPHPEHFVQPGHGKPSTRKRNLRRRLQRRAEAENAQAKDAQPTLSMVGPLEDLTAEASPTPVAQGLFTTPFGSSLTNGNKRRGFKQSMQDVAPQKIIFHPQGETSQQTPKAPTPGKEPYTLIPPSQRTDLPRNIIVTSVDVEEGMWGGGGGEGVRKEANKMAKLKPKGETGKSVDDDDVLDIVLNYSEDGVGTESVFEWARADEGFDRYRAAVREDIVEGGILVWKVRFLLAISGNSVLFTLTYPGACSGPFNVLPRARGHGW
jgi:hypothetical protein